MGAAEDIQKVEDEKFFRWSETVTLHHGDCLEVLKSSPDNSIESMVTDPPAGISFMGKNWDSDRGGRDNWISYMGAIFKECLRVLKPGAHALVWAIPKTEHWTATALEDAGFEIRDVITHIFSTGFPKSQDISKAIDRKFGAEREIIGSGVGRTGKKAQPKGGSVHSDDNYQWPGKYDITAPSTDQAKQWGGFGSHLKPASENWILVRKPIVSTIADNVLQYGTGGINIDACRIGYCENDSGEAQLLHKPNGRFPANLMFSHHEDCEQTCHPDCSVKMLDDQSGITTSGVSKKHHEGYNCKSNTGFLKGVSSPTNQHGGMGGASRFFYCAKASRKERGENNDHPTVKALKLMEYLITLVTPPNGTVLDPFMGSGSTGVAATKLGFKFIGIEKDEKYFDIAKDRVHQVISKNLQEDKVEKNSDLLF